MESFVALDPAPYIARIKCPVLALNGDKDCQVIPEYNLSKIEALCPGAVFFLEGEAAEQMQERFCFSPDPELAKAAGMPEGMLALSFEGDAAEILGDVLEEVKVEGRLRLAVPLLPETADGGLH